MKPYEALLKYSQFIVWKLTHVQGEAKPRKYPCDLAGNPSDAHNPINHTDFTTAKALAEALGTEYGVGFVLTERDPFFLVDIDDCLQPDGSWSSFALSILNYFPGCLVEISTSGTGLHVIGSASFVPPHAKKKPKLHKAEMYDCARFVALGQMGSAVGSEALDATAILPSFINTFFPLEAGQNEYMEWTTEPVPEWKGIENDQELLDAMLKSVSASARFGGSATFADLWQNNETQLAKFYPASGNDVYDRSSADGALAQHLAFWTGKNCERMERFMRSSGLVREKWERQDYLPNTIMKACSLQREVYGQKTAVELPSDIPLAKLRGSEGQIEYANNIRAGVIAQAQDESTRTLLASQQSAKLWINHRGKTAEQMAQMLTPAPMLSPSFEPTLKTGYQFVGASQQLELFKGCVYIIPLHRVFTPKGMLLKPEQMNAAYGGYVFQLDEMGEKTTRKAWEAFTESQLISWAKADGTWFRPDTPSGSLIPHEGCVYVNIYTPIPTERRQGDVTPFMNHVKKLLPVERDRQILLSYMAAMVQYKGTKFQWCPLLQGTEGNGKTLIVRAMAYAIGERYTHLPPANEISEKFNDWLFGKLFIGVEEIYVPEHKREVWEVLKPMITNDRLSKRAMQQSQVTDDNYANFILTSNYKEAVKKTDNDRRLCILYTAQQSKADLIERDGMTPTYFRRLYEWLDNGGYAIVNEFLHTYPIIPEFNPAGDCQRAPETSSTREAIKQSAGSIDTAVLEAIEEGRIGMMNGWVSSIALDTLLKELRAEKLIPVNRRKAFLEELGYVQHPHLHDGRVNSPIAIDMNKKPRLYIKPTHEAAELKQPMEIANRYQADQMIQVGGN